MSHDPIDFLREDVRDIKEDIKKIDDKIQQVLEWKWKIGGMSMALSGFLTLCFQVLYAYMKNK